MNTFKARIHNFTFLSISILQENGTYPCHDINNEYQESFNVKD
jgi:hypothetical protein